MRPRIVVIELGIGALIDIAIRDVEKRLRTVCWSAPTETLAKPSTQNGKKGS
ncbi:MAG: hypothetical protein ABI980_09200 [Nitrospirota bacterium]